MTDRFRCHRRLTLAAACLTTACSLGEAQAPARITNAIPWAGQGVWLKSDFHSHSRLSDGSHTIEEIAARGAANGCAVVAVADHSDGGLKGASQEYLDQVLAARARFPDLAIPAALEWNVPPGKGQEHATVLFPTAMESAGILTPFKERFDDENKEGENPELALQAFASLVPKPAGAVAPVVFFNHPNRRPNSTSLPTLTLAALQKAAPASLIGFEGAPGHQKSAPRGAYGNQAALEDRWDVMTAAVDGTWDKWTRQGIPFFAAIANSDFHNERDDYWPCEFAGTWLYAPDHTVDGVLRALHAGSFFAEHGHIVEQAVLTARFDGQPRPVAPGETATVAAGRTATVTLTMNVPPTDFLGRPNRIDLVELIGVSRDKTDVLFSGAPASPDAFTVTVTVPAGGIVLRARGRRLVEGEPALMFYTNPIRIAVGR